MIAAVAILALLQDADGLARQWTQAIRKINEDHAARPGKSRESDLAKRLPKPAAAALDRLVALRDSPSLAGALVEAGEAALDLDLIREFEKVSARLKDPEKLGSALSRDRYLLRGIGLDRAYLERFARVVDAVLGAYDELFGFEEWSKVPGKKLRIRIHLEPEIKSPPHFAPQFPFHSEIDFPVIDAREFKSPTAKGQFLFYGLCHELGHVIAMWGDRGREEDHHAWAHYTGVAVVEHLSKAESVRGLSDVRWRSLEAERKKAGTPSLEDRGGVLATLIALHDRVGPRAIGAAINALDREDRRLRINRVRYYSFAGLKEALLKVVKDARSRAAVAELIR